MIKVDDLTTVLDRLSLPGIGGSEISEMRLARLDCNGQGQAR